MPPLTYTDNMFLEAVKLKAVSSTGEVAAAVGCKPRTASNHLLSLFDAGRVGRMVVSDRYLWSTVE